MRKINSYLKEEKLSRSARWFQLFGHTGIRIHDVEDSHSNHWPVLSVVVFVIVQTPDHSKGKHIGLVFRIRPKNIMAHFVINGVNPLSL